MQYIDLHIINKISMRKKLPKLPKMGKVGKKWENSLSFDYLCSFFC